MDTQLDLAAEEIRRLRRCMNDLVSVQALPAIWIGGDPSLIGHTLLSSLLGMLDLDLVYVRLKDRAGGAPLEMARAARGPVPPGGPAEIDDLVRQWLHDDFRTWPPAARVRYRGDDLSVVPVRLGDTGVLVAASARAGFPTQAEHLLLGVAANQAAIGLQEARLLGEQRRVADELDRRVEQRTRELVAANEELRRSEAFLAEAQRLSLTGSFSWRVATDEITWSDQLHRIFQLDQAAPVTFERILSRVHPEDAALLAEMTERARREGSDFEFEHRLRMPDRSVRYVQLVAHALRGRDGCLEYIGAVQDVTDRRVSEAALGEARAELAHVARVTSLGALTASVAHEVSQPLSGILVNASTCLRMLDAEPPNVDGARETARRTIRDGQRASEVITRLRGLFARREVATEPVDLNDAALEVVALTRSELQRSGVVLRTELAEGLPVVPGDRIQLQQVILNLLLNASDAMREVDDRPRELLIGTEPVGDEAVRLRVRDAGVGIDPQSVDRLFDAFYTTKRAGMGIGLSVSRSIVEHHRGRLWAVPNDGPGATFAFSIPRDRRDGGSGR
jgi:signal transduction histidine kinase